MTQIYFCLDTEEETPITAITYDGYPRFNVGDIISLEVKNLNPETWDVSDIEIQEYEVTKIHHGALKYHGNNVNCNTWQYVYLKVIAP